MKYRKKPVVIEAIQWVEENIYLMESFLDGFEDPDSFNWPGGLVIETLEGDMTAQPGDYIIKGI